MIYANNRTYTSQDSENRHREIVGGRSWYLRATAAAGFCAAATPATANITHVMVSVSEPNGFIEDDFIDVIQDDGDHDPILGVEHVAGMLSLYYMFVHNGSPDEYFDSPRTGTDRLLLWRSGVERSGAQSVGQSRSFGLRFLRIASGASFAPPYYLKNGAIEGNDNYIGFRVTDADVNGGDFIYGWARLTGLDTESAHYGSLSEYAYQDDGSPIRLGQTSVGSIPEPSTLALLVLGAVGVAGLRWR